MARPSGDPARLLDSAGSVRGHCELGAAKEAEADVVKDNVLAERLEAADAHNTGLAGERLGPS